MSNRSHTGVRKTHPLADKVVVLNDRAQDPLRGMIVPGELFEIEDWWENLEGESINLPRPARNFAEKHYVERLKTLNRFTFDQACTDAVYGKIGAMGHLVHVSELGEVTE